MDAATFDRLRRWAGVGVLALIPLWRMAAVPPGSLWRDVGVIVPLYALLMILWPRAEFRSKLTAGTMAFLLGIYLAGQWPHLYTIVWGGP